MTADQHQQISTSYEILRRTSLQSFNIRQWAAVGGRNKIEVGGAYTRSISDTWRTNTTTAEPERPKSNRTAPYGFKILLYELHRSPIDTVDILPTNLVVDDGEMIHRSVARTAEKKFKRTTRSMQTDNTKQSDASATFAASAVTAVAPTPLNATPRADVPLANTSDPIVKPLVTQGHLIKIFGRIVELEVFKNNSTAFDVVSYNDAVQPTLLPKVEVEKAKLPQLVHRDGGMQVITANRLLIVPGRQVSVLTLDARVHAGTRTVALYSFVRAHARSLARLQRYYLSARSHVHSFARLIACPHVPDVAFLFCRGDYGSARGLHASAYYSSPTSAFSIVVLALVSVPEMTHYVHYSHPSGSG
ncbi:hypothetical protein C8Q76DRAFT_693605 [Earliella scabrosa]|nr:hypothetical protein C8Q76DRAFT_693605 [Earliella scabrosa]